MSVLKIDAATGRLAPGAERTWSEPAGKFTGTVVRFVPAGTVIRDVLPEGVTWFGGIREVAESSRSDRYVVRLSDGSESYRFPRADRVEAGS